MINALKQLLQSSARRTAAGLSLLLVLGAFLRVYKLQSLPPGLTTGEARLGLSVQNLIHHGVFPQFTTEDNFSWLMVWIEALPATLLGTSSYALRLIPVLAGVLAIGAVWLWARSWFGERVAWLAAFIIAVNPWSITLSREANPAALVPFLVAATFWLGTRAYRRGTATAWGSFGLIVGLNLLIGPIGWPIVLATLVVGVARLRAARRFPQWTASRLVGLVVAAVIGLVAAYNAGLSAQTLSHLGSAVGDISSLSALINSALRVVLAFNVRGDDNFAHNLGGEPLLNVFVGLMMIAGLLVSIVNSAQNRYRRLLLGLIVLIIPAIISTNGAPNALRLALVLPLVCVLSGIGIGYLLGLWYATFPVNAAAKSSGRLAIALLMGLSLVQGYSQYFHAYAGSAETYQAYNEAATAAAAYENQQSVEAKVTHVVIAGADEIPVLEYQVANKSDKVLTPAQFATLPAPAGAYHFIITAAGRNASLASLAQHFPGGKLKPHNSAVSDNELFYDYGVTKK